MLKFEGGSTNREGEVMDPFGVLIVVLVILAIIVLARRI